jgi:hypothetical protein
MYGMGVEKICENAGKWQKGAEKESSFSSGVASLQTDLPGNCNFPWIFTG